jgi:hypothetical protein
MSSALCFISREQLQDSFSSHSFQLFKLFVFDRKRISAGFHFSNFFCRQISMFSVRTKVMLRP